LRCIVTCDDEWRAAIDIDGRGGAVSRELWHPVGEREVTS
jgi:hypothetical protein